jgi:hypothetical protein
VGWRYFAHLAAIDHFPEAIQREREVSIGVNAGVVERIAALADLQRLERSPKRNLPERTVIVPEELIEWCLAEHR